jgi:hypothetical protein
MIVEIGIGLLIGGVAAFVVQNVLLKKKSQDILK